MGVQLREDVGGFPNGAAAGQVGDDMLIVGDPSDHRGDRPVAVQIFLNQDAEIDGTPPGGDQVKSLLDQVRGAFHATVQVGDGRIDLPVHAGGRSVGGGILADDVTPGFDEADDAGSEASVGRFEIKDAVAVQHG